MSDTKTIESLQEAGFVISSLLEDARYEHMRKPWEMVFGGLILRAIADLDPNALGDSEQVQKLLEDYTPEKVNDWFEPKVIREVVKGPGIRVVGPSIPGPKRYVYVTQPRVSQYYDGKHRRLKSGVDKPQKQVRELEPADRDIIIRWWNDNQRLINRDSTECQDLARACGRGLAPYQVAGCISQIARKAMWDKGARTRNIFRAIKRGAYSVPPQYSEKIIQEVTQNYNESRKDEDSRRKAHRAIREKRQAIVEEQPRVAMEPIAEEV